MKKMLLTLLLILGVAFSANAAQVTFEQTSVNRGAGEIMTVDLIISGLDANLDLSAFDIEVLFDETMLSFTSYSLTNELGEVGLDAEDFSFGEIPPGTLNLANLTINPFYDFSLQADDFTLATMTFETLAYGYSDLDFGFVDLSDALGDPFMFNLAGTTVSAVPVPGSLFLLGMGLIGLTGFSRRRVS